MFTEITVADLVSERATLATLIADAKADAKASMPAKRTIVRGTWGALATPDELASM